MTLLTLILYIAIVAVVLTVMIGLLKKGHKSWLMTFLQNFTGVLFIVSGFVKAVDPMGTAFKMEQYFTEFQYTFAETSFNFLAPLFPFLSSISLLFSVVMIVFEVVLGIMLLIGYKPKLTAWLFLILVLFFTVLTGFTFLTGYVPSGTNFFRFASWGPYAATNMRVPGLQALVDRSGDRRHPGTAAGDAGRRRRIRHAGTDPRHRAARAARRIAGTRRLRPLSPPRPSRCRDRRGGFLRAAPPVRRARPPVNLCSGT